MLRLAVAGMVLLAISSCRKRGGAEWDGAVGAGSENLEVNGGSLGAAADARIRFIRTEFAKHQEWKLAELQARDRLENPGHFKKHYSIVIGDTTSCFAATQAIGHVRLGVDDDGQRDQLLNNLKSVLDFALSFYDAMDQGENALFNTIELCGVGRLAKHIPTENRSKRPLELHGRRLVVWNDKFIGGYSAIRTDALMRSWSSGDMDGGVMAGPKRSVFEKAWPIIDPIGPLRIAIRQRLAEERSVAMSSLQSLRQSQPEGSIETVSLIEPFTTSQTAAFRNGAVSYLESIGASDRAAVANAMNDCLRDRRSRSDLEELGVCSSLTRTSRVTGDQLNFSLLVGVMNFHNIQVGTGSGGCAGEGSKTLALKSDDGFNLKQRCVGLLVSVCTVDNVQVLAQLSLVPKALPTLCLARALKKVGVAKKPFVFDL
jgi:hypothetical protein